MRYINELQEDERVIEHYYCKKKQAMKSRAGKSYFSLKLQDKTGVIEGKVWDLTPDIQSFEENEYIKIDGTVVNYMSELQIKIIRIRRSAEGEYDPVDYVPATDKDIDELYGELQDLIKSVKNTYLNRLLTSVFDDADIREPFKKHSAAKAMHHNFMGGLLEHTVSVAKISDYLSGIYNNIDRDLLITAAIFHDIGKISELSPFPENDYTDDGRLLGHTQIGIGIISEKAAAIDAFPPKLLVLLKHCLISHHGEYIYGAARRPKIIEAMILYHADDTDAKVKAFESALKDVGPRGQWTGYDKMFERYLRRSGYEGV